jgi:hypothetical protein
LNPSSPDVIPSNLPGPVLLTASVPACSTSP